MTIARSISCAAMLALAVAASPATAQTEVLTPGTLERAALELPTGRALWSDVGPATGPVAIVISLPLQVAYVYRDGALIGVSSVSTGKPGKETPTGTFEILQKKTFHRSNLYSNAPMPFMQRLTWDGIALHAGDNPGYPASHGCIRFPAKFAKKLFDLTTMGGTVAITDAVAVAPPGVKVPRLVAPPGSFSFGSEPIIASRPEPAAGPQPIRRAPEPVRLAQPAPAPVPVRKVVRPAPAPVPAPIVMARAEPTPRLIARGFEPIRR